MWREAGTKYHAIIIIRHHTFCGEGVTVCAGFSLDECTNLHVFAGGNMMAVRHQEKVLDPYFRPYASTVGPHFLQMDNNAHSHRDEWITTGGRAPLGTRYIMVILISMLPLY